MGQEPGSRGCGRSWDPEGGQRELELQEPATTPPPRCPLSPERGDDSLDSVLMLPLLSHQCRPPAEPNGEEAGVESGKCRCQGSEPFHVAEQSKGVEGN